MIENRKEKKKRKGNGTWHMVSEFRKRNYLNK